MPIAPKYARRRLPEPRIAHLPFFTGRPDLPPWVPLGFHLDGANDDACRVPIAPGIMGSWSFSWASRGSWDMVLASDPASDAGELKAGAVGFLRMGWKTLPSGTIRCLQLWWDVVHDSDMPFAWWKAPSAEMPSRLRYFGAGGALHGCRGERGERDGAGRG